MTALLSACRSLLAYTVWANRIHLGALERVTPEDLVRDTGSSHGTLLRTMAHILGGQQMWLSRFLGNPLDPMPGAAEYPDLAALKQGFEEFWPEAEYFLASLTEEQLLAPIAWLDETGGERTQPLWQPLLHMADHSSYHRGQIVTMLRQLGYQPPFADLVGYFAAAAEHRG